MATDGAMKAAIEICRETYDHFVMGGREPQDDHEIVAEIIDREAVAPLRQALQKFPMPPDVNKSSALERVNYCISVRVWYENVAEAALRGGGD